MPAPTPLTPAPVTDTDADAATYEALHVHTIYDAIAPHFSSTRHKPWPIIAAFLDSLSPGSVGLDAGTGNGKYLPLCAGNIWTVGVDRSRALLEIAQHARAGPSAHADVDGQVWREVVRGDVREGGMWRTGAFDYALSIATIHHLATPARRQAAIEALLHCVSPAHGRVLIYVWAIEQDALSKRMIPPDAGQDVFVPWVVPGSHAERGDAQDTVFRRFYHLFVRGELRALVCGAAAAVGLEVAAVPASASASASVGRRRHGIEIVRDGWERSNWYIELRRWQV